MNNPFDSSHRKLDRCRKHFLDLQGKVSAFIQSSPYHEVVEPHPDKADHEVHKVKPTRALTGELNDIGDDFGEFVSNLRSALDNAGYAIAAATGKTDSKHCAFPFAASLPETVKACRKVQRFAERNPIVISWLPALLWGRRPSMRNQCSLQHGQAPNRCSCFQCVHSRAGLSRRNKVL